MIVDNQTLTSAIFPSAGSVHLYHAVDAGIFAEAGLEVDLHEVRSSDAQMVGWDRGEFDVMHTSPDHLLRTGRSRDPVAVRAEGLGELVVLVAEGADPRSARWGVDGIDSAFAFVLQAILEDVAGVHIRDEQLHPLGGTKQRFEALLAGEIDGTTLHPPFDRVAIDRGFARVGGHLESLPHLLVVCAVAPRGSLDSVSLRRYLEACERSARALLDGGLRAIRSALEDRGWPGAVAQAAAEGVVGPAGLAADPQPDLAGIEAAAALRRRFDQGWEPARPLRSLLP
jgi:hypothetical protein